MHPPQSSSHGDTWCMTMHPATLNLLTSESCFLFSTHSVIWCFPASSWTLCLSNTQLIPIHYTHRTHSLTCFWLFIKYYFIRHRLPCIKSILIISLSLESYFTSLQSTYHHIIFLVLWFASPTPSEHKLSEIRDPVSFVHCYVFRTENSAW